MNLHLGILGGGNISQTHMRAALEIDGVKIAAVYGQNADKARRLADAAGANGLPDAAAPRASSPARGCAVDHGGATSQSIPMIVAMLGLAWLWMRRR